MQPPPTAHGSEAVPSEQATDGNPLSPTGTDATAEAVPTDPQTATAPHDEHAAAHPDSHHTDPHHDDHSHDHPPPIMRLRKLLKQESSALWVVLIYAIFIGLLTLATPVAVQALVNQVTFGQLRQPLLMLTLLLFLVLLFSGALRLLEATAVEKLQQRLFVRLGSELAALLPRVLTAHFRKPPGARLVSRFFEIITVQKSLSKLLLDGLALVLQSLIGLLVLGFYHPLLLGFDVILLLSISVIVLGLGRGAVKTAVLESRAKYDVADWLMELGSHSLTLRGAHGLKWAVERADDLLVHYVHARRQNFAILRRQIIGALLLQAIASATLLGLGGTLVIMGQLTLGQLVAAELIVSTVVSGVLKFTKHMESYYDLLAGLDKLGYFDDLKSEREDGEAQSLPARPTILFQDVQIEDADNHLRLSIQELLVPEGARAAVVGARSKKLLAEVLYGLRNASQGRIEIAGFPVRAISMSSLRDQVALLQDTHESIVAGTIADNLRIGKHDASLSELREALAAAALWNEVSALPLGLETHLLSGAPGYSATWRWRLALARVILQKPKLVIVDGLAETSWELSPLFVSDAPWTLLWIGEAGHPLLRKCSHVFTVEGNTIQTQNGNASAAEGER